MDTNDQTTRLTPDCGEAAESLAAGALMTTLPELEQARLQAHLLSCAECRRRYSDYAVVVDALLLRAPVVTPPAGLRDRIVADAKQRRAVARPQAPVWRPPSIAWQRVLAPAFGLLAAMLLGWGLGLYVQLRQQVALGDQQSAKIVQQQEQAARNRAVAIAAFGNPDAQERQLEPAAIAPGAEGRVLLSPAAPAMALYVKNLPPLAPGQVYHIWWEHEQVVSIGTFTVDGQGRAWSLIQPKAPLAPPRRIFVTAEPSGDGARPSGPVYLSAQF